MTTNLTIGAVLAEGAQRLTGASETPWLDAELLLAHVLGESRTRLKSHPERAVDPRQVASYFEAVDRRAAGEPLAYLTGRREFWSLPLAVTPAVLVPRPETELVVERALALCQKPSASVADLGTGSGAIAIALASERPGWKIVATDASEEALSVARGNAAALAPGRIEFLQGAWFAPLAGRRFDLIVSNPPYVADGDPVLAQPPLCHEPRSALVAGEDGLSCLREIIRDAPQHLHRGGWIVLEHGATQAADVARELVARGFGHVRSHRDLAGHERVTEGQWDPPPTRTA